MKRKAETEVSLGWLYFQEFMVRDDTAKIKPSLTYSRKAYKWIDQYGEDHIRVKLNVTIWYVDAGR